MTDEDAFLRVILDRPLDDTPRLVYADWLDDHGDPARAEFIRVQVALANHSVGCGVCTGTGGVSAGHDLRARIECWRLADLRRRERELFEAADLNVWFPGAELGGFVLLVTEPWSFLPADPPFAVVRRGFIDSITVPTLATLFGGECPNCDGEGRIESPNPAFSQRCRMCEGTPGGDDYRCSGRTPGIAAAVFAAHPVTRVLVDELGLTGVAQEAYSRILVDTLRGNVGLDPIYTIEEKKDA